MVTRYHWLLLLLAIAMSAASVAVVSDVASTESSYVALVVAGPGQFLTTLAIGTPPSPFTAILDTGSDLLWRQCLPCTLCYPQAPLPTPVQLEFCALRPSANSSWHRNTTSKQLAFCASNSSSVTPDDIFDPALSSSYAIATCSDPTCRASYGSCSSAAHNSSSCSYDIVYIAPSAYTRGILSYDSLSIFSSPANMHHSLHDAGRHGGAHSFAQTYLKRIPHFVFGCSHESKGPYNFAYAGGIVGLGRGPLSLPSQLNVTRFSYCLGSINDTSSPTPLVLGRAASLGQSASGVMSLVSTIDYAYVVEIEAISVGGKRLAIATSSLGLNLTGLVPTNRRTATAGIIFDSGTTFTHLPSPAFQALYTAFSSAIAMPRSSARPRNLTLCYQSSTNSASTLQLPSLSFHFHEATMHLPPDNYFVSIDGVFCLAFLESSDDLSIFGNVQQQNYHILYDLESNTISFKPAQCRSLLRPAQRV